MKFRVVFLSVLFIFTSNIFTYAQEHEHEEGQHEEHHKKHAISAVISHTHIRSGVKNETGDNWMALPSFAVNYNFSFNEKWAIGLHNDIIIEEFIIENPNYEAEIEHKSLKNEEPEIPGIERSRPISSAVMLTYKPFKHIAFLAGGGMEFSKEENFALVRLGMEFPFHIPNDWEIFGVMAYDININAYDSFTFGLGIAKLF